MADDQHTQQHSPGGGPLRSIADDPTRSVPERALAEVLIAWMRQRQALHARTSVVLGDHDLSFAQVKLLFHLPVEGTTSAGRFAADAGMTPAAASQALDALEREGLVERTRSQTDRRIVEVGISEQGRSILDTLRSRFQDRWAEHIGQLDAADLETTVRVLESVVQLFAYPTQE